MFCLRPIPHILLRCTNRGKRNESSFLCCVRDKVAEVLGISPDEVEHATDCAHAKYLKYESSSFHIEPAAHPAGYDIPAGSAHNPDLPPVFKRVGIPQIVGLILSGVVVGHMDSTSLPATRVSRFSGRLESFISCFLPLWK